LRKTFSTKRIAVAISKLNRGATRFVHVRIAQADVFLSRTRHRAARWSSWIYAIGCALSIAGVAIAWPWIDTVVAPLITAARVPVIQQIIMALGGALVGATVITFSFIMFALQVNVERMPHGLFQRLSSDWRLLVAFLAAFVLAIGVLGLSVVDIPAKLVLTLVLAIAGTISIVFLVLYSYSRALRLINPIQQLELVLRHSRRELAMWSRRASRSARLHGPRAPNQKKDPFRTELDIPRLTFFQTNTNWSNQARKGIDYAIALARYYAEHGDHEVSGAAIQAIVAVNAAYVHAKGDTFVGVNPMMDTPLTSDGFCNETLDALRQIVQSGISRADERQIEQAFRGLAGLALLYTSVPYGNEHTAKHHARLAAGYLESAIESVVPHDMPDVLLAGVRVLGEVAIQFVRRDKDASSTITPARCILGIAATGLKNAKYRSVSQIAVGELARITLETLVRSDDAYAFGAKRIREGIFTLASLYIQVPEIPLQGAASQCLASYFSLAAADALPGKLRELANELLELKADDKNAQRVIRNISQWGDQLALPYREVLREAIKHKSFFAFDLIHGIKHLAVVFSAISTAPACPDHTRDELRKSAVWLLSALTWIPAEKDAVTTAEGFNVTEQLFEAALEGERFEVSELTDTAREALISWTMKAGSFATGWASLDRGLFASAILAIRVDEEAWLLAELRRKLLKANIDVELREAAAERLVDAANEHPRDFPINQIDHEFKVVDHSRMRTLAGQIAALLRSPGESSPDASASDKNPTPPDDAPQ
jgi:hypothetical protein